MKPTTLKKLTAIVCLIGSLGPSLYAEAWPTYRHDNRRSGVTSESLELPFILSWQFQSPLPPQPAWSGPAKWDSYAKINYLKPMRNFDPVFYTVSADGRVYFGSSVDDGIHCLDLQSGREVWTVFTDAPVRVAPAYEGDRVYAGSDDGRLYCVNADSGAEQWTVTLAESRRSLANNGRLISTWPCRTGALVQEGIVYGTASLLPWEDTFICALDALTGGDRGPGLYRKVYPQLTTQGPLLASSRHLYVSQGRQAPLVLTRADGRLLKSVGKSGFGGVFGLLTEDETFVHGHGQNHGSYGELRAFDAQQHDLLMTYPKATTIVSHANRLYIQVEGQLRALQRDSYLRLQKEKTALQAKRQAQQEKLKKLKSEQKEQKAALERDIEALRADIAAVEAQLPSTLRWQVDSDCALDLILAGDTLFAGGDGRVVAYAAASGVPRWEVSVPGRAFGLTVADGHLLISTDRGAILCFRGGEVL